MVLKIQIPWQLESENKANNSVNKRLKPSISCQVNCIQILTIVQDILFHVGIKSSTPKQILFSMTKGQLGL